VGGPSAAGAEVGGSLSMSTSEDGSLLPNALSPFSSDKVRSSDVESLIRATAMKKNRSKINSAGRTRCVLTKRRI
jgi:hypothetical protein